jgi:methylenetetrahydrofolate dehydrogenase (NADP+)/methenyltetrahydrofolate cyclohydrolase
VGQGTPIGRSLELLLKSSEVNVETVAPDIADMKSITLEADVIITVAGKPSVLTSDMIKHGAVVVDAGVTGERDDLAGEVAPEVYERSDLTITPLKGGVGPLAVCALFENVIRAAKRVAEAQHNE